MSTARRYARRAHLALAALFLLAVVVQFFLAGMALFAAQSWHAHVDTGYFAGLAILALPLLALAARLPLLDLFLAVSLALAAWIQILLPQTTPWLAAVHPLWALVVLGLAAVVVRRAVSAPPPPSGTAPPPSSP